METAREILGTARALGKVRPAGRVPVVKAGVRRWRWGMVSGVAAMVVAGAFAVGIILPRGNVSAAEALAQATTATAGYEGWVHTTVHDQKLDKEGRPADGNGFYEEDYVHSRDGVVCRVNRNGEKILSITVTNRKTQITERYTSGNGTPGTIERHRMAWGEDRMLNGVVFGSEESLRALIARQPAIKAATWQTTQVGGMERISRVFTSEPGNLKRLEVDVDTGTHLLQATRQWFADPDGPPECVTTTYRYGEEVRADVYALGAPRDARVVNHVEGAGTQR
jgi:hypothetical protein